MKLYDLAIEIVMHVSRRIPSRSAEVTTQVWRLL
jgi:hypothetical protein